jgi:hypothetical protein
MHQIHRKAWIKVRTKAFFQFFFQKSQERLVNFFSLNPLTINVFERKFHIPRIIEGRRNVSKSRNIDLNRKKKFKKYNLFKSPSKIYIPRFGLNFQKTEVSACFGLASAKIWANSEV